MCGALVVKVESQGGLSYDENSYTYNDVSSTVTSKCTSKGSLVIKVRSNDGHEMGEL